MSPFRLIAAPHTPMRPDGSLDLERVEALAGCLVRSGVSGAFVCGSTGEFASLTTDERMRLAERWVAVARGSLRVLVHVGHTCLADGRALATHAQKAGADAVAALGPFFFRPAGAAELAAFCGELAAAAPGLPFYYYHIPVRTGLAMPMAEFLPVAGRRIPTLAGLKFTHEDLMDFARCLRADGGRYEVLFGRDEMLLAAVALGAAGAVGTTYGYAAPLYLRLVKAFGAGDLPSARADQARAVQMIDAMYRFGGLPASKAMMRVIGLDCGPVRPPMAELTDEQYRQLRDELERIGFLEFCNRV